MDNINNEEKLVDLTQSLVEKFYQGDAESILNYIHEKIVLVGETDFAFYNGKAELAERLRSIHSSGTKYVLKDQRYVCVCGGRSICVIVGSFIAVFNDGNKKWWKKQRSTFCWKYSKGKWEIHHIHLSNPAVSRHEYEKNDGSKGEDFNLISENESESVPRIIVKDKNGVRRFVSEDEIIYIQADNMESIVYCLSESFSVRLVLKDMEAMLSDDFIRVHKSYIVNKRYVENILRYNIHMAMDFVIPVSKIKYKEIEAILNK